MSNKSVEIARNFKVKGNACYKKKRFHDALISYNSALCFVPPGSEEEALIYANRSAVFLENRLFEKCLLNIQKAEQLNHPKPEVLKERREKCQEMMGNPGENNYHLRFKRFKFDLVFGPHENFPFLSNCIEFRKDVNGQPHIYSSRDLKIGDVIAFAEPFSPIINDSNIFVRCNHCLKDNLFDLYPCKNCSNALYCSEECQSSAFHRYHRYECGELGTSSTAERVFFEALSLFNGDVVELENYLKQHTNTAHFLLDFDFKDSSSLESAKNRFLAVIYSLDLPSSQLFEAWSFYKASVLYRTKVVKNLSTKKNKFVENFLKRLWIISKSRIKEKDLCAYSLKVGGNVSKFFDAPSEAIAGNIVASSLIPLIDCFQHSCASDTKSITIDGNVMIYASRPVKAGDEIFYCKSFSYDMVSIGVRRLKMKEDFGIECKCKACLNGYQTFLSMVDDGTILTKVLQTENVSLELMEIMSEVEVFEKLKLYCLLLEKNISDVPNKNMLMLDFFIYGCFLRLNQPEFFIP